MRRAYCAIFFIQCIFLNTCLGELTVEKKQEFLNRFIESLNNQPDKSYIYEEGVFVDAQKTNEDNTYKITVRLKVSDIHDIDVVKILKCSVSVIDGGNGVVVQNEHQCEEDPDGSLGDGQDSVDGTTESPAEAVTGPVQLANEVQSDAEVTSGEQFVAVPRPSAPCIGCATHVDPTATGVPEMAHLGIRHLDLHDSGSKHSLKSVVDVERQVQVVNGVRYILTLLVDFNNCTAPSVEPCPVSTPCKISILEKPWKKLPDGSKYRTILANNCTAEWLFGDEGEVLPSERNSENNELYPDSSGNFDDDLRVVHNFDTQAQPNQEKTLTDDMVKSVEDQIIPFSEFKTPEGPGTASVAESSAPTLENTEHVHEDETVKHYVEESAPAPQSHINQPNSLNEDQRRAIDDMMNFFNFAGFHKPSDDHQRNKRSYSDDLKVLDLAKKFQKMKRSIDHANYVHKLARFMVEYLNEHDMFVKNRILKDVLAAEQEIENDKHFFYLQALITIPCDSEHCKEKEYSRKICNGVIDGSNKTFPQILNTFCYDDEKEILSRKSKTIPFDDPILAKLAKRALIKIESQSTKDQAMRILKILDATTQNTLGRLTRISMLLSYTNCKKTLDFNKRLNCSTIEDLGSEICDVTIHERINKKNEMKINYICNERGIHESFVDTEHSNKKNKNLNDPEIQNMIQEALQFLEKQSNINKKQKLVSIKSISTKVVAGLVTEVAFTVGYSDCQNDENVDINTCQLLLNEAIRECKAQVWDRPWLENGRQVNVKCENEPIVIPAEVEHKQIPKKYVKFGKVTERNPNDIKYKQLAEESLQKYLESVGISLGQTLVQVSGVTTQVVSGLITEIDFDVYPTNGDVFDCHSKIWDQPLLNKKDITVDCNMFGQKRRVKRQIDGGITQQDPSKPEYKALAEESLLKYLQTSGGTLTERKIEVNKVTEQVVAGSLTRIDFTVRPLNGDSFTCHSKVWEQPWVNKKDITVKCNINEKQTRVKRHVPGGQTEKDPSKPEYKALAEESLQKYLQTSGDTLTETEVEVNKVTVQVVAGSLTRIDFTVRPLNGDSFTCHSEVWEQPWLNKKEIDVNCNINEQRLKVKRQLIGGQIEKDPSKPEYKALAEESLQKYLQTSGGTLTETKIDVNKVTVQVVAGFLTRIDFTVRPLNGDSFTCHSKVWEQAWLNKKDITVNCDINDKQTRAKRQIPGGQTEKDPRKPEYKALAEESLQKYLQTSGSILDERKIEVTKVTTQVVSGSKTSIDFTVHPLNGDSFTCHSEVWEQSWLKKKDITVNCNLNDKQTRVKRQIIGGETENDPSKPEYKALAEESLQKYLQTSGSILDERKIEVTKVTTQVVSGSKTRIDFTVHPLNGDSFTCHSEVWEQSWLKKKDITVNCNINDKQTRVKRQIPGGQTEKDPSKPEYKALAEESLQKYLQTSGSILDERKIEVTKVTTQVVSGSKTSIDFTVHPLNGDSFTCHSEVWEQSWLKKKDITVNCNLNDNQTRVKRQIIGGENENDPSKPEYKALAEESLQKYLQTSGIILEERKIEVTKVTTQVVSGSKTRIDFTVHPLNGDSFTCHSEVWEQAWLNKKDITVNCNINDKQTRVKRRIPGGQTEKDPSKPEYKALAEESLQKYLQTSGSILDERKIEVTKVTTQVVSGSKTSIDFTVHPLNGDSFTCHSEVWEQSWLKKKDITVNCNLNDNQTRVKRQIIGGENENDPSKPEYKALAEESLQKYLQTSGSILEERKIEVTKVTTQVVSGSKTRIDFTVHPLNGDSFTCHSEVWEQAWLNKKDITVNCNINDKQTRVKRQIPGGQIEKDPRKPEYKALAEESLQKYLQTSGSILDERKIEVTKVTTQVVSGSKTSIDFTVHPLNGDSFTCHSEVWEQSWLKKKDITVNCNLNDKQTRVKRQIIGGETENDPSKPEYKALAEESLQKYLQTSGSILDERKIEVTKVTTQVVSGSKTSIDFTVHPLNGDSFTCHSEVWEQSWLKKKDITVNCNLNDNQTRVKRQIIGGENENDPSKPEYKALAEESLQKYLQTSGSILEERKIEVTKVTTQVVSGSKTRIDFTVHPLNGDSFTCHSEVWEQAWLNKKDITVNCNINDKQTRVKRQIPGGQIEKDPRKPEYKALAEESLQKYLQTSGSILDERKIEVTKVTTQVVSGSKTSIDFTVHPLNGDSFTCHSEVWEQSWLKKKDITVNCNLNDKQTRVKRQIIGGETENDPSKPEYKALAEESLQKYLQTSGSILDERKIEVTKVTTQVVSGSKTRIDFTVHPLNGDSFTCHSEVWEQSWLKKKDITVNCNRNDKQTRVKRQIIGGETEKDPSKPEYKALAEESLQKYLQNSGGVLNVRKIDVIRVTSQVVSGSMTRIAFIVHPLNGDSFTCHSEVWEQPWINKNDITVMCGPSDQLNRKKREMIGGGLIEPDLSDRKYHVLAEESLQKYLHNSGGTLGERKIEVTKVTVQVVSGVFTGLEFDVLPANGDSFSCRSEVLEQTWANKKEINVDCHIDKRRKREIAGVSRRRGSPQEEDSSKPEYKALAEKSLQKYLKLQNKKTRHDVLEVKHVTSQVVAGRLYEIDFTASPTRCSNNDIFLSECGANNETVLFCHSKIWSRVWLKSNKIEVICNTDTHENLNDETFDEDKKKRSLVVTSNEERQPKDITKVLNDELKGKPVGIQVKPFGSQDDKFNYKGNRDLAQEAILKFERLSNAKYMHKLLKIHRVSEQINEGILTTIEFSMSPTECLIGNAINVNDCKFKEPKIEFLCLSTIWERSWIYLKDIKVSCKNRKSKHANPTEWDDEIPGARQIEREKRQLREDDDYIEDDLTFYYADRAVKEINDRSQSHNLQKLITVHAIDDTMQMGARMIRMYIETAVTFCLRPQAGVQLSECEEIDGLNRRLCLVRLWPDPDDELVVQHVAVVCDDDSDFASVTGISIPILITASIKEIEKAQNIKFKLVHQGEPNIVPTLSSKHPIKMNFIVASTNCSKDVDVYKHRDTCFVDTAKSPTACESMTWLVPNSMEVKDVTVKCYGNTVDRKKRSANINTDKASIDITIGKLVDESLEKLEASSAHRYKQRVFQINTYSTKIQKGRVTTIDFDVGFTSCLKYEYVANISSCEFIEHLPRRHCVSHVFERLWVENGRNIEVICEDDESPLEPHVGLESSEMAMELAKEAVKHIEAKYPYPRRLKVVRIFSLEKQALAGIHYRMKIEVGVTDCMALSVKSDCKLKQDGNSNKFCRVNVWIRPWTEHAPNFRVWCDYQESLTTEHHHMLQAEQLFYDFLTTYSPDYVDNYTEMAKRFTIFRANVRKVHELNVHERGTARYAMTRFSDLTYKEFTSKYLGLRPDLKNANNIPLVKAEIPEVQLPDKFDWRDHGAVTEVKNQGSCGSCWAFSVTGNIEGQWKLQTGKLLSLSEQELVDCDKLDQGCDGGLPDNAYRAIEELGGLELESDYPYEGEDDKCVFNKTIAKVQISGAVNISSNETDMAKWLVGNGPISIGINANAMQFYVGGISHPWKMLCSPTNLDHGVLIVGFGAKDYPLFHKHLPYWVIKNSWGKQWGEQGYYRVYRGDGTCGVNQMASSAVV